MRGYYGLAVLVGVASLLMTSQCDPNCAGVDGSAGVAGAPGRDGLPGAKGEKGQPGINLFKRPPGSSYHVKTLSVAGSIEMC